MKSLPAHNNCSIAISIASFVFQGEDLKLILEGEILKLVDPKTKHVYHVQPIAKMRVWGVGREGEEKRSVPKQQQTV